MLQAERDDWNVSYELGDTWKNARKIKLKNSSCVSGILFQERDYYADLSNSI